MVTARLLTQLPIIMGLSSASLILILILSISTPFTTLCIYSSSSYSLPAIKSMCVEYVCRMWSLLSRAAAALIVITPTNIFLLVNLIIFFLFINMHLQQHAAGPAAEKRSSRKKRQQQEQKLIMNDYKRAAAPLQPNLEGSTLADYLAASAAAADMESEASSRSSACAAELRPLQGSMENFENLRTEDSFNGELDVAVEKGSLALALTVDSERINDADAEQIVLDEDGRLRLMEGPISPKGSDAKKIEDGRPRLIELANCSDAEKIVLEKDGRLRLIDRPLPSSIRPEKSLSDNYYPSDTNHNVNYDTPSLNNLNYGHNLNNNTHSLDNHHDSLDNHSLNNISHSNLNEVNKGTLSIDYNLNPNLNHDDAHHSTFRNKGSSLKRTISRPIRVKKSDSLDATWKAINHNKGSETNYASNRDPKHLIRQSSRKDFKPSRGGRGVMRDTNYIKVKREPSISQDELNAKVESFIAKFNEQIRIERQQSILSYMQMVDRGA